MKFEFHNLGTIQKTTLDLRPLTVILGPNNTSKTYLAYCVHGLLTSLSQGLPVHVKDGKSESAPLPDIARATASLVTARAHAFAKNLSEFFQDTRGDLFRNTKIDVRVDPADARWATEERRAVEFPSIGPPCTLPAERNALIITYKLLSARRYRVLRDHARSRPETRPHEPGDIRYPAPIEDFLDFLTDVELDASRLREDPQSPFGELARRIEQHIQGGHQTRYAPTMLGARELTVTVDDETTLDLYNASSSIKQLAPLLLYLRYRAAPRQTLIIDEPEMNLHPEAQAKLLEALGMLANLGVRVLITTHSPYFMAHLNNLIASDPTSPARKRRQAKHLYMADPAAFLSPSDVSAYEMRAEGLKSLSDPEYGIRWDTLSDVSAELQRRYFAIVEEPKRRAKTA